MKFKNGIVGGLKIPTEDEKTKMEAAARRLHIEIAGGIFTFLAAESFPEYAQPDDLQELLEKKSLYAFAAAEEFLVTAGVYVRTKKAKE